MGRLTTEWRSFHTQVLEHQVELGFSLRVTIAAVVGFAVSLLLHVPLPLWTVLTAVILTQVNFGRSLKATVDYLAGTLGGAVYSGAVAAVLPTRMKSRSPASSRSRSPRWLCSERSNPASAPPRSRGCSCSWCRE
jgi:hypothetical protein